MSDRTRAVYSVFLVFLLMPSTYGADESCFQFTRDCIGSHGGHKVLTFQDLYVKANLPDGLLEAHWRKPKMFKFFYADKTAPPITSSIVGDKLYGDRLDIQGYSVHDLTKVLPVLALAHLVDGSVIRQEGRSYEYKGKQITEILQNDGLGGQIVSLVDQNKTCIGVRYKGAIESDYMFISMGKHIKMAGLMVPRNVLISRPRLAPLKLTIRRVKMDALKNSDSFFSDPKERARIKKRRRKR